MFLWVCCIVKIVDLLTPRFPGCFCVCIGKLSLFVMVPHSMWHMFSFFVFQLPVTCPHTAFIVQLAIWSVLQVTLWVEVMPGVSSVQFLSFQFIQGLILLSFKNCLELCDSLLASVQGSFQVHYSLEIILTWCGGQDSQGSHMLGLGKFECLLVSVFHELLLMWACPSANFIQFDFMVYFRDHELRCINSDSHDKDFVANRSLWSCFRSSSLPPGFIGSVFLAEEFHNWWFTFVMPGGWVGCGCVPLNGSCFLWGYNLIFSLYNSPPSDASDLCTFHDVNPAPCDMAFKAPLV